ncbi:MAG: phosphoribosyl-ATP diphosphatase [Gammaproteobacteria bacterium]|nr:phosphoribosyl-ATP diphosphatase [Gammaproteobacteria bacterium]
MNDILRELARILAERRQASPGESYVASLYVGGLEAICRKVEEEAKEVIEAAGSGDRKAIVHEVADLWFHTLVLLSHSGLEPEAVLAELERRFGHSGLEEKAARARKPRAD